MPRQDGRIEPGQRLSSAISARAWNRAQQAADIVLGSVPGTGAEPIAYMSAPYTWVYAKNQSGGDIDRWGVMTITGVEITPTASDSAGATLQFGQMPVLSIDAITQPGQRCIAIEPIAVGKVGRVAVAGVVQVKSGDAEDVTHATVLWRDANWALIRFGGGELIRLGTIAYTWAKGATATVTQLNGDGTEMDGDPTFEAINHFITITVGGGSGGGPKKVACGRVGEFWILIAAECD